MIHLCQMQRRRPSKYQLRVLCLRYLAVAAAPICPSAHDVAAQRRGATGPSCPVLQATRAVFHDVWRLDSLVTALSGQFRVSRRRSRRHFGDSGSARLVVCRSLAAHITIFLQIPSLAFLPD